MRSIPVLMINTNDLTKSSTFPSIRAAARYIGQGEGSRKTIAAGVRTQEGTIVRGTRRGRKAEWFVTSAK